MTAPHNSIPSHPGRAPAAVPTGQEWEVTVELAHYLRAQRQRQHHQPAAIAAVIADLTAIIRASSAFPGRHLQSHRLGRTAASNRERPENLLRSARPHLAHAAVHLDRSSPTATPPRPLPHPAGTSSITRRSRADASNEVRSTVTSRDHSLAVRSSSIENRRPATRFGSCL